MAQSQIIKMTEMRTSSRQELLGKAFEQPNGLSGVSISFD